MTSSSGNDPRVDDLRQRLRALGYLDAGVDRFVLGSARQTRHPAMLALLASVRVGALAALVLGPAAALGLSGRLPGLITGTRDAFVVAIYLGGFFGVSMAAASLVVSLLVYWVAGRSIDRFATRGRRAARAAGALVTVLCVVYLTLWWQTVIAGLGWSSPLWTLSALTLAVAMSLLLGHAVSVAASAVVLSASRGTADGPGTAAAKTSARATIASAAIVFGVAALLFAWTSSAERRQTAGGEAITVVPSGLRVRVIAIDGFDSRAFDTLAASGRVPALSVALSGASMQLRSRPGDAGDPARVWTTVATGQPPEVHAVQGLETRRLAGVQGSVAVAEPSPLGRAMRGATDLVRLTRPAIASGSERRAKTFWEVAAEAGLRTVVVNWWATWPAPPRAGVVLSDRAVLRLERGGALDAEIAPGELYEPLREKWSTIAGRARQQVSDSIASSTDESTRAVLLRSAELDAIQVALLQSVVTPQTDLAVVYLPGLDIAQHALLGQRGSGNDASNQAPSTLSMRLEALNSYYAALDKLLAPLLQPAADEIVVVVTEPGRVGGDEAARLSMKGGPTVNPDASQSGSSTAVAPTILYALGVPMGKDLPSPPLVDLFDARFRARYPVRFVETYGVPSAVPQDRAGQPLDQEMIDRLRSLGYVR
jgi:Type I phosphodiesterase / nucleotide pyrophosphatase